MSSRRRISSSGANATSSKATVKSSKKEKVSRGSKVTISYGEGTPKGLRWQPIRAREAFERGYFVHVSSAKSNEGGKDNSVVRYSKSMDMNNKWYNITNRNRNDIVDKNLSDKEALKLFVPKSDQDAKDKDIIFINNERIRLAGTEDDVREVLENSEVQREAGIKASQVQGLLDGAIDFNNWDKGGNFSILLENIRKTKNYKKMNGLTKTKTEESKLLDSVLKAYYAPGGKHIALYNSEGHKISSTGAKKREAKGTAKTLAQKYDEIHEGDGILLYEPPKADSNAEPFNYVGFLNVTGYASHNNRKKGKIERIKERKDEELTVDSASQRVANKGFVIDRDSRIIAENDVKLKNNAEDDVREAAASLGIKRVNIEGGGERKKTRSAGAGKSKKPKAVTARREAGTARTREVSRSRSPPPATRTGRQRAAAAAPASRAGSVSRSPARSPSPPAASRSRSSSPVTTNRRAARQTTTATELQEEAAPATGSAGTRRRPNRVEEPAEEVAEGVEEGNEPTTTPVSRNPGRRTRRT